METNNDQFAIFERIIEEIKVAMLVTKGANGKNNGRPMNTVQLDDDGHLWFFTNDYAGMVKEIAAFNEVYLSYAAPGKNTYMTINGMAELVADKAKMEMLWKPAYKIWFADGLADPNMLLLKITPIEVEYWDGPNKVAMAVKMLKAFLSGEEFKGGEHEKMSM